MITQELHGKNYPSTVLDAYQEYLYTNLAASEGGLEKNHPDTAAAYGILGDCYSALDNNEKALEYYQKALSIYRSMEGLETKADKIRQSIERLKRKLR